MKLIEKIDRNDLNSLLVNDNQSYMSEVMIDFANSIPSINSIEDIHLLDRAFFSYFKREENGTEKFEKTASEIFERKTVTGCSDIGLAITPILRYKGIPTVYLESAEINWLKDKQENNNKDIMSGHVFLEIFLNNNWYLYDPTFHLLYLDYDHNNLSLPRNYYAYAKALNAHDLGVFNTKDERKLAINCLNDFDISKYKEPNYDFFDIRFEINSKKHI